MAEMGEERSHGVMMGQVYGEVTRQVRHARVWIGTPGVPICPPLRFARHRYHHAMPHD